MLGKRKRRLWYSVLAAPLVLFLVTVSGPFQAQAQPDPGGLGPYTTNLVTVTTTNPDNDNSLNTDIYYPAGNGGVDPSAAPYAALVFAPGFLSSPAQYTGNGRHLASWGYIVAIPDFPSQDVEVRTSDVRHLLSYLEAENENSGSLFYGKIDIGRLAVTGHSLGGVSTLMTAAWDARIRRAGVALDPAGGPLADWDYEAELPDVVAPMLIIGAGEGGFCNNSGEYNDMYPPIGADHKAKAVLEGGSHCDFLDSEDSGTDTCYLLCGGDSEGRAERLVVVERYSSAWFNYYLQLDTDFYTYLYGAKAEEDIQAGRISMEVDTAPKGVAATDVGSTVELSWTAYEHPIIAGYNIYRSQESGAYPNTPYAQVGRVSSFVDTGPVTGQRNYYVVRSRDAAGNEHQASVEVSALPQGEPPGVPILLQPFDGSVTAEQNVTFAWTPSAGGAPDGYELKVDGTVYDTTGTTWSTDLTLGVHTWTVRAYKGGDYSDWASPAWSVEVAETLPPPGVPVLSAPPDGEVSLSRAITFVWEPSPGGLVEAYNIRVDGEVMTTTHTAWPTALSNGLYTWTVRAQNASGTSAWAPEWTLEVLSYPVYMPLVSK
jgi:pimeloyl-ACP methyl ester carboxylesterase